MQSRIRQRHCALLAAVALAAGACGMAPNYSVTEHSRPFVALNGRAKGEAPAVSSDLDYHRLLAARSEPQNWLTYYGTYDGQRYSSLTQINAGNVGRLKPAWVYQNPLIGLAANAATFAMESTPIVVEGVVFASGPDGFVWALDAKSGALLWEYHHAVPIDVPLCCGNVNRGVAVANGKVLFVTPNGHLIGLDARTGKPLWDSIFVDVRAGESATLAPLIVKNFVLVGSSGGEYGVRGHIDAFDIDTGRRIWRRYTIPKPNEPGGDSWTGRHGNEGAVELG